MPAVEPFTAPFSAYLAIREVLEGTGLRADSALFGSRTNPSPLKDRAFRLNFGSLKIGLGEKQRPGDNVNGFETLTIHLSHDLKPRAHDESWQTACTDLVRAIHALLSDARTRGMIRMNDGSAVRRVSGHSIETDLVIAVHWSTTIPAAYPA